MANFSFRIFNQLQKVENLTIMAKIGGATGNLQSLQFYDSSVDWISHIDGFIQSLPYNIEYNRFTTQIEPHDYIVEFSALTHHLNSILIG